MKRFLKQKIKNTAELNININVKKKLILSVVVSTIIFISFITWFIGSSNKAHELIIISWFFFFAGSILFLLSVKMLKKWRSLILLNSGVYSIIRHPLYLGIIYLYIWIIFGVQNLIITILSMAGIACLYWQMVIEEDYCIKKYGQDYRRYMNSVPRINLLQGIIRLVQKKLIIKFNNR